MIDFSIVKKTSLPLQAKGTMQKRDGANKQMDKRNYIPIPIPPMPPIPHAAHASHSTHAAHTVHCRGMFGFRLRFIGNHGSSREQQDLL